MATSTTAPPRNAAPTRPGRLPRVLHPGAWWIWALGMATAASRTTNPLLLGLVIAVVAYVVAARRTDAPWARGFRYYLYLAVFVVAVRMLFRMLFDGQTGATVLFHLPEVPLPDAAAGVRIGGPVSAEGLLDRALRRPATGDAAGVRRRRERAGEPEAPARVAARGAVRARCHDHRRADHRAAAGRERPAGAPGPTPAGRGRSAHPAVP